MTRIKIDVGKDVEIRATGHSEYNTEGPDIVCAAVSTLCGTWLECATAYEAQGVLANLIAKSEDGDYHVKVSPCSYFRDRILAAASAIITGFRLLQKAYPEHVNLEITLHTRGEIQK